MVRACDRRAANGLPAPTSSSSPTLIGQLGCRALRYSRLLLIPFLQRQSNRQGLVVLRGVYGCVRRSVVRLCLERPLYFKHPRRRRLANMAFRVCHDGTDKPGHNPMLARPGWVLLTQIRSPASVASNVKG